jgi:predicted metal-binding membrane protein
MAVRRETTVAALLIGTSAAAWLLLWRGGYGPSARFSHAHMHHHAAGGGMFAPFLAGWLLMLAAMMLPTTLPLHRLFSQMTSEREDHWQLLALAIAGYLSVWSLFGVGVYFGEEAVLVMLHRWGGGSMNTAWLGAISFMGAGLFQFTPLKYRCLQKCRSPLSVITAHWTGRHPLRNALRLGVDHAAYCVGCCWALMLLMFAVGAGSLGWMLVLGGVMALEKNFPWGQWLAKPLGSSLVLGGVLLLIW